MLHHKFFTFVAILVFIFISADRVISAPVHSFGCKGCHLQGYTINQIGGANVCLQCHSGTGTPANKFSIGDASNNFGNNSQTIKETSHNWSSPSTNLAAGADEPLRINGQMGFFSRYGTTMGLIACSRCHNPHGQIENNPKLLVGTAYGFTSDPMQPNDMCLACHAPWDQTENHGWLTHPIVTDYNASVLTEPEKFKGTMKNTYNAAIQLVNGGVSCSSCHDIHFVDSDATTVDGPTELLSKSDGKLLRGDGPKSADKSSLCQTCHTYMEHGDNTGEKVGCLVCHSGHSYDPSAPNYFILRKTVNTATFGLKNSLNYSSTDLVDPAKEGDKYSFWQDKTDGTANGYCERCHGDAAALPGSVHDSAAVCTSCHSHRTEESGSFGHGGGGTGCEACHGHDIGYQLSDDKFSEGAGTSISHSRHTENDTDDAGGPFIPCERCHDMDSIPAFTSGTDSDADGKLTLPETDVCDSCHQDATGLATGTPVLVAAPEWNVGTVSCNDCHGPEPTYDNSNPKANSHAAHNSYSCGTCHAATTVDGSSITGQTAHTDGVYTLQATSGRTLEYTFDAAGGTCSNISCHGTNSATWGVGPMQCDSCHGYPPKPGDGNNVNELRDGGKGVHHTTMFEFGIEKEGIGHVDLTLLDPASDVYGEIWTGFGQCAKCHFGATHFNDTVEVSIANEPMPDPLALSYDGLNPPVYEGTPGSFDTPKTCYNTRCHMQRSPRWSCPGDE